MLQQFLRTASDGWDLALASARNLFAEADLHADEVGGDFAAEAHRLGGTLARCTTSCAERSGPAFDGPPPRDDAGPARRGRGRPRARHETAAGGGSPRSPGSPGQVQRVHGDLHLGQTLRTSLGWKLVDFEGEPAKELASAGCRTRSGVTSPG